MLGIDKAMAKLIPKEIQEKLQKEFMEHINDCQTCKDHFQQIAMNVITGKSEPNAR